MTVLRISDIRRDTVPGTLARPTSGRQHGGVTQPALLASVRDNAVALHDAGDLVAAIDYLTRALESARAAFGDDEPEVLNTARLLARLHRRADDPAAARRILEEALAGGEIRLGGHHPAMLTISYDLGEIAEELGNRHEARRNFGRVVAAGPAVLGADHRLVAAARDHLARSTAETLTGPVPDPMTGPAVTDHLAYPPAAPAPAAQRPSTRRPSTQEPAAPDATPMIVTTSTSPAVNRTLPTLVAAGSAAAAVLAAAVAVVVGVVVLFDGERSTPRRDPAPNPPAAAGDPPTEVALTDDGVAVTLTWTDPTAGSVPFIVASGRAGAQLGALATINPGQTLFTINGLSPDLDYCFAVLAVYSTDEYAPSAQVCTDRNAARTD
ncbi:tetratricopeptide repeat protein [Solwaraspora sp. WMMD406]|uniref:fibronectin type III domain-containing protein n=1 Tax=Solwaraspora sp. WMMD406 TaxID=3016095 RepID=UPI0024175140|nr:tetratricopeptide repeat protein [Solwaraspora sp. WMMD406]MDG4765694.1 tetratricopeptide repeat protein [Solwaraspora sp. WMMD406]